MDVIPQLSSPAFALFGRVDDAEVDVTSPYELNSWLVLLKQLKQQDSKTRLLAHLKAVFYLPRSYKLWTSLFNELELILNSISRNKETKQERKLSTEALDAVDDLYQRAVAHLPTLPSLRLKYCAFLWKRRKSVTATRRQFDETLRVLPVTQHHLVWKHYLAFIFEVNLPLTTKVVLRRFIQLFPEYSELYVAHLQRIGALDEAARVMSYLVRDESFQSLVHSSKQAQWLDFCLFLSKHGNKITSVAPEKVIRTSLKKFPEDIAALWCCLATFYGVMGNFDLCCFTYDEALSEVRSTADFKVVFESYARFLEAGIVALQSHGGSVLEIKYQIQKLESLLDSREDFLSSVRIRRNPNDVYEWLNRIKLFCRTPRTPAPSENSEISKATMTKENISNPLKVIQTFSEAIQTVDPLNSTGLTSLLWIEWAHFYELFDEVDEARAVLERACKATHKNLDSLVLVWCERVELELRHEQDEQALRLARAAVKKPVIPKVTEDRDLTDNDLQDDPLHFRLHRSPKLWALCASLEESFGTFQAMRAAYDKMFDLKVITVPQILCLGEMLEKKSLFEDAFKTYERGVHLFRWPHLNDLWIVYLSKFVSRYGSRKLDRARELFERVLSDVPKEYASRFYFIYAKYEEHFGFIRNALSVLHRAVNNVPDKEKSNFYKLLIYTTAEYFGLTKTRPIFDEALKNVPDDMMKEMGMWYASVEASLIEVDRARAIYEHVAPFCDVKRDADFWKEWRMFELTRGDEETFREMLRKRRAVASQFEEMNALNFDSNELETLINEETEKILNRES
eukprot:Blabericola_migrator_1__4376@NODE_234_length_11037_cov_77_854421_g199_i0_p2_GENE_NODE_234_length_11037_cov_77_854421_g199_i0NODE_234_length_11037_cov_77_854421_g199_i0_p2_ORF_typecomplete_len796_score164_80Suf/PF05843_14/8_4e05Suf/PF05843_14/62Suf/PF05843_14/0_00023Suf/PF05843_14/6_2e13Suf/PF05843_14/4_7e07TPR_15/PF13429_6/3_6e02TPR_15/PF13429_6/1_5e02TPR_15/PF13429_6/2_7e02TPR_15/PF13429_6/0_047TPR_15/PF13429_6/38TPR_15/PF13429_6/9_2e05TPR_15/PF13429_6/34TPR_MalT/PF17874_1/6_2e03TPR_MalT/PF1787